MGILIFTCPKTGQEIDTGVETHLYNFDRTRFFSLRVRCPNCKQTHQCSVADGRIDDSRLAWWNQL